MEFLYGIIGFMFGAVLVYWLQKRHLTKNQQRLKRTETALEQAEASNRQQATQLQKFREAQPQNQNLEQHYQNQLKELQQSYEARLQELEQSHRSNPERDAAHQAALERLQTEHEAQLQQTIQELETKYQSRLAELEKAHQLQLEGLRQSPATTNEPMAVPASPAPLEEEAWKKTQAYWGEPENPSDSSVINPFISEVSGTTGQSSDTSSSEFDLAELLEAEGDASLDLDTWQPQSQQSPKPRQDEPVSPDLQIFEVLETENPEAANLPEIPNKDSDAGDILPDLFSDSESEEGDLQEFLSMLESEGEPENKNGQVSSDRSKISFS